MAREESRRSGDPCHEVGEIQSTNPITIFCWLYKGSAPRAADATRYARARKNTAKCEGGTKKDPWFGAASDLIMPRANCAELIALCCAVCVLGMSRSDRQYGCNLRGGET